MYRTFVQYPFAHFIAVIPESGFSLDVSFIFPGRTIPGILQILVYENGYDGFIHCVEDFRSDHLIFYLFRYCIASTHYYSDVCGIYTTYVGDSHFYAGFFFFFHFC